MRSNRKVIIITGGNSGLGKATAEILAKNNKVIILGRNKKTVDVTAKKLRGFGVVCDVTDINQIKNAINSVIEKYGRIDCLVNCAGVFIKGPIEENNPGKIKDTILINALGPILMTHAVVPQMKKQKQGRIVNVVSIAGKAQKKERSVYNASKWAITGHTKCLQLELLPHNISVMGFYPGFIHTDIGKRAGYAYKKKDFRTAMPVKKCASILASMVNADSELVINDLEVQSSRYFY